jgi:hypothetical protein
MRISVVFLLALCLTGCGGNNRRNPIPNTPKSVAIPLPPQSEGMSDEEWLELIKRMEE